MILVIDVGTTGLRASLVAPDASIVDAEYRWSPPETPFPGLVEFDATQLAGHVLDAARTVLERNGGPAITGVGITNQRATTIVWERATGRPIGPALGWQDLRTVGECITAKAEHGLSLAPNQSATKIGWLLGNAAGGVDPAELCFGTVDTWIAWTLSEGALHVTDHTNAAVTGLYSIDLRGWHHGVCERLGVPVAMLPEIVDSSRLLGAATALPGAPPIAALVGDQQASLVGQGCIERGMAKITFGTGGMLDMCTGPTPPESAARTPHGSYPIVAWSAGGEQIWGVEAVMLSAGTNVDWLRDDMRLIDTADESHTVAASCDTTEGVVYVPALLGLGTPQWDFGARGTLLGLTRGSTRAHIVRAVLEGVAHRGADLVEAAEADTGLTIESVRVDGGMSRNPTFVQALADASGKPVEVSPVVEATTRGAAYLAGVAAGVWPDLPATGEHWAPSAVIEPSSQLNRAEWAEAVARTTSWIPELSALHF
jgi:glycerol kinase